MNFLQIGCSPLSLYLSIIISLFGFAHLHVGPVFSFVILVYISNIYTPLYPGFIFILLILFQESKGFQPM